ncbi:MAG: hypothetical protein U9N54_07755, partial [candidate division Zixibacteria bacterium]|nr:hypothetical protein [candidate division Zixibacteria bacterium]
RKNGLEPIKEDDFPLLFLGSKIREYLKAKQKSTKNKLNENEIYCVKCKVGVVPKSDTIIIINTDKKVGKNALLLIIKGFCPECSTEISRFASTNSIISTPWNMKFQQGNERLKDISTPCLNTDKTKE